MEDILLATGNKPALDDNFGVYSTTSTPSMTYYHTCMVVWKRFISIILNLVDGSLAVQVIEEYNSVIRFECLNQQTSNRENIRRIMKKK